MRKENVTLNRAMAAAWSRSLPALRNVKRALERLKFLKPTPNELHSVAIGFDDRHHVEILLRVLPHEPQRLIRLSESQTAFNAGAFLNLSRRAIRSSIPEIIDQARKSTRAAGREIVTSGSLRQLSKDIYSHLGNRPLGQRELDTLLYVLSMYGKSLRAPVVKPRPDERNLFPDYNPRLHGAAVRYGSTELAVVKNYLLDRDNLRRALDRVLKLMSREGDMYADKGVRHGDLSADDPAWNLRVLMTNGGFYVSGDPAASWQVLEDWAERYIGCLRSSWLVWHNTASLHFIKVQHALHERYGFVPRYISPPNLFRIYEHLRDKDVLVVSPLADVIGEQASSGRLYKLFKHFDVPSFSLRTVQSFVSTWPNRPHTDWTESFALTCRAIDAAYQTKPFDLFMAACGCYGLPLCEYVRSRYGCNVLYLGNVTHAVLGIRMGGADRLVLHGLEPKLNPEMWVRGDLGRYANLGRIDRGRYT